MFVGKQLGPSLLWIACAALVLLSGPSARAEDTQTSVALNDGVPDGDFPLNDPFSLTLPVSKETVFARAVFVEVSDGFLGSRAGGEVCDCRELSEVLDPIKEQLQKAAPGPAPLRLVLSAKAPKPGKGKKPSPFERGLKDRPVLLTSLWKPSPPAAAEGDGAAAAPVATLRVPGGSFFHAGANYCLLAYTGTERVTTDDTMVVSNVRAFSKRASACNTPDCFKQALEALGKVSAKDPKGQPILRSKLESLVNTGLNLVNHKKALGRALDGLGRQLQGLSPLVARTKDQDDVAASLSWHRLAGKAITPENVSPFGELVANLLVRKGLLRETGGANGLVRSLADGKAIDAIALDGHSLKVRLADANSEPREREVAVSLTELAVPPVGLTLNDWVLLARGRIQLDAEVTTLADLAKRAQAIELGPIPDSEMEFWSKVSARFMSFDEAIRRLDAIAGKVADSAEHQLARWLFSGAWGELVKRPPLPDGPGVAVSLPGLATLTSETTIALRDWKPRTGDIKTIARETRLEAQAGTQVGMSQETWFFTYVTPTVGYATTRSDFGIPLTGIQIYPFPNPIDVPMWTGKDDWRRIFSLELGLSPRVNAFGPDDRYSGPGGLPPLYAGIGVQLLPYTVVSVGGLLAERRNSTLPEERAEVFVTGYFAGSVQINVPDLIAALNTRKSQAEK